MAVLKEKTLIIFLIIGGIFMLSSLGLLYFNSSNLIPPIIIHFDSYQGVSFLGTLTDLWSIWLVGFIMIIINFGLSEVFFYRERLLSYLFVGTNIIIALLVLIILAVIISVN